MTKIEKLDYEKIRDNPNINTSLLSPHIKFGTLSIREVFFYCVEKLGLNSTFIKQLIWREFYANLFLNIGEKRTLKGGNYKNLQIKWSNNDTLFQLWSEGNTGFPFIDAGMRQLNSTGWMHNRTRMACANFLSMVLHIDWKLGEKYFASKLLDYDVAQNNGNWQWSVGLGIDRTGYVRVYNPQSQLEKHDPQCTYIKKWINELKNVDSSIILSWQTTNKDIEIKYPKPCVDYKKARLKTINELYN